MNLETLPEFSFGCWSFKEKSEQLGEEEWNEVDGDEDEAEEDRETEKMHHGLVASVFPSMGTRLNWFTGCYKGNQIEEVLGGTAVMHAWGKGENAAGFQVSSR